MRTPFYQYNWALLDETIATAAFEAHALNYQLHYAMKANANPEVLKKVKQYGLGADCVSGNEILHALEQGIPANEIVYAGVGKTDEEIRIALEQDIFCFHVESIQELEVINAIAAEYNKVATVALRLNPNVCGETHEKISTGLKENKFGFQENEIDLFFDRYYNLNNINFIGLHFHIGSQITSMRPFIALCNAANYWMEVFEQKGFKVEYLNLGGGLGVNYDRPDQELIPDFAQYFSTIKANLKPRAYTQVHFEPGRALVAHCADLITSVLYVKNGATKNFAIVDAGMTDFLRPALYNAFHKIEKINDGIEASSEQYSIVGPICESSDCFGNDVALPSLYRGDLIKIRSVGAYGESMRLDYNMRQSSIKAAKKSFQVAVKVPA